MGELLGIDDTLQRFIAAQRMYFVSTAPLAADGHVNLSPKGLDTFRVIGPYSVAYLDYPGSGAETIAHLRENGRIALMFCAFEGPPRIVRLHGRGEVVEPQDPAFADLRAVFEEGTVCRAIILVAVERVADSCGFGVPRMVFDAERTQLPDWMAARSEDGLRNYQREKNESSLDGLPTLRWLKP
jgi:hypothetical protein